MSGFRLPTGGRIDRSRPLGFTFDRKPMQGFAGDSLASALLANGVGPVGRSFKYRRPRGIHAAGVEDPNAMLAVRDGHGTDPALRAGQVVLTDGLEARSVTGWPSPRFDIASAITRLAAPFMPAGFYYKTLKWPNWSWYEGAIRRQTGFGAPDGTDTRRHTHRHDMCDVLVIGAGPAGLAAARALAPTGRRIIVVDSAPVAGGSLRWEQARIDGSTGRDWAERTEQELRAAGVTVLLDTFVTGAYDGNFFTLCQSLRDERGLRGERIWKLFARTVVLATGCFDRPILFPNNDRPGVMLAAAVRQFIGEYGVAPGRRLVVFADNDSGLLTAIQARAAGISATLVDRRPCLPEPGAEIARKEGVTVLCGAELEGVVGARGVRGVVIKGRTIDCDAVAVSGGVTPAIHLAAHRGAKPVYDAGIAGFHCPDLPEGWRAAGAVAGARGLAEVLAQGHAAGLALGGSGEAPCAEVPVGLTHAEPTWQTGGKLSKMFVDLQNDVKASDIALAARENYTSVEHLKRYTTLGMGTDQGRTSNVNGLALMARVTGRDPGAIGTTTFRPPYVAVRMGAIANHRQEALYRPGRRMPAHEAHAALGAEFEDFGWERPDWYRCNGADRDRAAHAEMRAVRTAVGVFDASPLGKIEVAGADARTFLDRLYVTNIATLKPGRIRYSVMCRDDGVVFDDGVVTCIDERLFLAGPTSGNAETVAAWFERWHQTEWPDLQVAILPVTSQWAAIALAGPAARALLQRLEPDFDVSAQGFAHMQFREGTVAGLPARVARVSFTGEVQYEVSVPARYGHALFETALRLGADLEARPVGLEAWLRLRVEKGYPHLGADINGRTTPVDLGLAAQVSKKQADFIGKRALSLPFNRSDRREQLVGLRPTAAPIRIGARILASGFDRVPCPTVGYVTSVCDSPELGNIALALVENGQARSGERVRLFAEGEIAEAEICSPVFLDPGNERLRR